MKPEPKFVPGELVVIESLACPEHNGKTVEIVDAQLKPMRLWSHDGSYRRGRFWVYRLPVKHGIGTGEWWGERTLRKLPPSTPSTFDAAIWQPKREGMKA
jgi:hypothetical protein